MMMMIVFELQNLSVQGSGQRTKMR